MRALALRSRAGLSALALLALTSCPGAEAPTELPPQLSVSTSTLTYSSTTGTDPQPQTVQVNNSGGGGALEWTAVSNAPWLTITPTSSSFTAFVAVTGLSAGTHQATITVTAPGASSSPQSIAVTLTLTTPPTLALSVSTLTFSGTVGSTNPPTQNVNVSFSNNGAVAWTASDDASWLSVAPSSGTGAAQLTATVNTAGLSSGTHNATITVSGTGTSNSPQTVAVTLNMSTPATISLSPTQLTFNANVGANPPDQTFNVGNNGGGTMGFLVSDDQTWLTVSPTSGSAGSPQVITVAVASSGLAAGTYTGTITVSANGATNTPQTVAVTLVVANNFNGTWTGKTSQDSTVRLTISNNAVTQIYLGWSIASCGTTGNTTTNFTQPFSVSSGSFSRTVNGSPMSYTITGNFSSGTAVSGSLTLNFSMTVPFSCSGSANLTWNATKP